MAKMKVDGLGTSGVREVDIPDYPSNSNKSKEDPQAQKKKVRHIATATPRDNPKSILDDIFKGSIPEARKTIWDDQIKPGLLDMGANAMYTLIDYIFYHGGRSGRSSRSRRDRIDYANRSKNRSKSRDDDYDDPDKPIRGKWNQVVIKAGSTRTMSEARQKAQEIWEALEDSIETNGSVTVGDLFSAAGWTTVYTDFDYGWKTLDGCQYVNDGDGFWFDMTKPVRIE